MLSLEHASLYSEAASLRTKLSDPGANSIIDAFALIASSLLFEVRYNRLRSAPRNCLLRILWRRGCSA
jgi:hypothetical protein